MLLLALVAWGRGDYAAVVATLARQLLDARLAAKPGSPWNRMRDRQWSGLNPPVA